MKPRKKDCQSIEDIKLQPDSNLDIESIEKLAEEDVNPRILAVYRLVHKNKGKASKNFSENNKHLCFIHSGFLP